MKEEQNDLIKRVAYLEFVNDQLASEIKYVDSLLRSIGFPEGLETVKQAAQEISEHAESSESEPPQEASE